MDENKKLFIMDQDVLETSVGIFRMMPSNLYAVLVTDGSKVTQIINVFHDRYGIKLEDDEIAQKITKRLGVKILSFHNDDYDVVKSSQEIIELMDMEGLKAILPSFVTGNDAVKVTRVDRPINR